MSPGKPEDKASSVDHLEMTFPLTILPELLSMVVEVKFVEFTSQKKFAKYFGSCSATLFVAAGKDRRWLINSTIA